MGKNCFQVFLNICQEEIEPLAEIEPQTLLLHLDVC